MSFLIGTIGLSFNAYATHIRAGEITVERVSCSGRVFRITITAYTDTGAPDPVLFGDGNLDFGDGSDPLFIDAGEDVERTDLGDDIALNKVVVFHEYRSIGDFIISYEEPNRNEGILNIANSVTTPFYIETKIAIDSFFGCNSSPILSVPPIDGGCMGVAFFHNAGAFDPDGDSLSYEFTIPKQSVGTNVNNYRDPNLQEFYSSVNYGTANEEGTGAPTFTIDNITGDVVWDAPGAPGEYNIAFRIIEWRQVLGEWFQIGYVTRDMQIIIDDCDNERPELEVPNDTCIVAGTILTAEIFATDAKPAGDPPTPDHHDVKIEAFSQILRSDIIGNDDFPFPATVSPDPAVFQSTFPEPAKMEFTWETNCQHIREQPYQVRFKASDNPNPGEGTTLVTFKTWNIRIVPPPPKLISATRSITERAADLVLENYKENACTSPEDNNVEKIQIWRRVDSYTLMPDTCDTGMPDFAGYELIDEVDPTTTNYKDDNNGEGLDFGAKYCYRLVATYPLPEGGESIVSEEQCIEPILAEAPIITHVTVEETDPTDGKIRVSWRSPFDIDESVFPPPYTYRLIRAEGLSGETNLSTVTETADTTFVDTSLDTENNAYNYRIELVNATVDPIETSSVASSVRLDPTPRFEAIELNWRADVPWSNNVQSAPYHLIYRGTEGQKDDELVLIDSVNVNSAGFFYRDEGGQLGSPSLSDKEVYCYRIQTRGSYGNPDIDSPLENFSQTICAQPSDTIPPCAPVLTVDKFNCRPIGDLSFPAIYSFDGTRCDIQEFENVVKWTVSPEECREDIDFYQLYFSRTGNEGTFEIVAEIPEIRVLDTLTFFHDVRSQDNRLSFAGCYKVKAVDRSGNESEFSNTDCKDNCPNYILPNVITVNGDGKNDVFRAFNATGDDEYPDKCVRFVNSLNFVVYNRWGNEVFDYSATSGDENSLLIEWDGKNNSGKLLSAGVYFYVAEIDFDVVNPDQNKQKIKGWIHVIY